MHMKKKSLKLALLFSAMLSTGISRSQCVEQNNLINATAGTWTPNIPTGITNPFVANPTNNSYTVTNLGLQVAGIQNRVSRSITPLSNNGLFSINFTLNLTNRSAFGPSVFPVVLTNQNLDPDGVTAVNVLGLQWYSIANNQVNIFGVVTRSGASTTKVITPLRNLTGADFTPVLGTNYFVSIERRSNTEGRVRIFSDANRTTLIASTCFTLPTTLNNLSFLQIASGSSGGNARSASFVTSGISIGCLQQPTTTITASKTSVCMNETVTLTATSTNITNPTYTWFSSLSPTVSIGSGASIKVQPAVSGTVDYFVQATSANECMVFPRVKQSIVVNSLPVAPSISAISVCKNQIKKLVLTPVNTSGVWKSLNTNIATVDAGYVTGISQGQTTVEYSVTNSNNCVGKSSAVITVNDVVNFKIVGNNFVCPNSNGNVYSVDLPVDGADYTWNIQDAPNVGVYFPVSGSKSSSLYVPSNVQRTDRKFILRCQGVNACGISTIVSKEITLTTDVPPTPQLSFTGTAPTSISVSNNSTNQYGVNWTVWGGSLATKTATNTNTVSRGANQYVNCVFVSKAGCKSYATFSPTFICSEASDAPKDPNKPTSFRAEDNSSNLQNSLELFPNPSNGNITLNTTLNSGNILISNTLGEVVKQIDVVDGKFNYDINLESYPKGIYLVRVSNVNETQTKTFVIE